MVLQEILVRRYLVSDHTAVLHLHVLALEALGAYLGKGFHDEDLADIEATYLAAGGEFLVVIYHDQLIAMCGLRPLPDDSGEIKRMRVHPEFQGQGIGHLLLTQLEDRACALGYTRLCLDTSSRQPIAQHVYQRHGYCETHRAPIRDFEIIFMAKELARDLDATSR